jgi:hypothetical protein
MLILFLSSPRWVRPSESPGKRMDTSHVLDVLPILPHWFIQDRLEVSECTYIGRIGVAFR